MAAPDRQSTSPWLITYGIGKTAPTRLRLFCFHYAGATASIFRSWQEALPDGVELLAIQLPGRDYRFAEPLLTDMKQIATEVADVLPPLLDRPFVFFGHSMGALLGFDLIRILRARGLRQPELLIAAGRNAPQFKWRDAGIQALPDDDFVAAVRDYNGTPEALLAEKSLRELWLPRLRADLTVSGLYEYVEQRPLACPIVVMSGEDDRLISDAGQRGWLAQTIGGVRFFRYPGDHFFLHNAEPLVLADVRAELEAQLGRDRHSRRRMAMTTPGYDTPADGTQGPPVNQRSAPPDLVRVFDTTLRDGEQSPGATLNADEKLEIAEQLARLGVDIIEAGFPASSPGDLSAVQRIAVSVGRAQRTDQYGKPAAPPCIAAMARASRADIDKAWLGVRDAKQSRIHIVLATSDIHLEYKLRKTRPEVLDMARQSVSHARKLCGDVEFSPEDATRSDREFLVQVLETVIDAGATTLNIPDTVGYATPEEYGGLISFLRRRVAKADSVVWSVHCHDDLGLATANTLAGIMNGGRQIEVSINGIGERAGNACLAEVVMALHTRKAVFNLETNIVRREICRTSKMVSSFTGMLVQPNKAIVGANAFAHEAGIHQDGVLKNKRTYEIMDAEDVGLSESRLVLGKHSGRNALRSKLEKLGYHVSSEALDQVFRKFKDVVDLQKVINDAQLHTLCAELSLSTDAEPAARLEAEKVQA